MRSLILAIGLLVLGSVPAKADEIEGPWLPSDGGLIDIVPTGPGRYSGIVVRPRPGLCPAPAGAAPYSLLGSFPDYVGTRTYVLPGSCASAGLGSAVYRLSPDGLTLCSRPPGDGFPLIDDPASDCTSFSRPGAGTTVSCGARWLHRGRLRRVDAERVTRRRHRLTPAAYAITMRGARCDYAETVLRHVLDATDERLAVQRAGLPFVKVDTRGSGSRAYIVEAGDGGVTLRYRRIGGEPGPDHRIYRAGQRIIFGNKDGRGEGGACTSGFTVRLRDGSTGALTAGHCPFDPKGKVRPIPFWFTGTRRTLGSIAQNLWPGTDAMTIRLDERWRSAPQVERGDAPPLTVVGAIPNAQQVDGMPVCFTGRSSGADRCGKVSGSNGAQRCTDIRSRNGDSGGPVYYAPDDGFTRAVGIEVADRPYLGHTMCYVPIDVALAGLDATLVTGP